MQPFVGDIYGDVNVRFPPSESQQGLFDQVSVFPHEEGSRDAEIGVRVVVGHVDEIIVVVNITVGDNHSYSSGLLGLLRFGHKGALPSVDQQDGSLDPVQIELLAAATRRVS